MRKIKFRGKTLKNEGMLPAGSWVEGGYCVDYCYGGCPQGKHFIIVWSSEGLGYMKHIEVDPDSVGEYTGLKDRNGKEIYEGDIVEHAGDKYRIGWHERGFELFNLTPKTAASGSFENSHPYLKNKEKNCINLLVIGNIYENPELLEVAADV